MHRDGAGVLYTSFAEDGALSEIAFHWGQFNPRPTKPVILHTLQVVANRTLKLVRADIRALGVLDEQYAGVNLARTQEIGAAVEFMGCDGLIAPCARWRVSNCHTAYATRLGLQPSISERSGQNSSTHSGPA
jgi:RES domain